MRLTATATKLKPFIDASAKLAPQTGKRPQLECTRIDVRGDRAVFSATNLIETVRLIYSDEMTGEDGSVYLPSVNLQRVIREAKREEVTIEWNGKAQKATATFGAVRVALPVEPPDNLPVIPGFSDKDPFVTLLASAMAGTLARTTFAVQANFMARALAGVSLKIRRGQLEAAATDGTAIAIVRVDVVNPTMLVTDALLPPISHEAIARIAADKKANVDLQLTGGTLHLRGPGGELTWRLRTGQFPDYDGHVPERLAKAVEIPRRDLLSLLDKAHLLKVVTLPDYTFTVRRGELELLASAGIDGSVRAALEIEWPWPSLEISLDPGLLEVAVKAMDADMVSVGFESPEQPVLLREVTTLFDNRYAVSPRFK
jgi:DNA polymerase III sliding clamp (beta) subunit (PCNA family)